jgi:hypothetical protein
LATVGEIAFKAGRVEQTNFTIMRSRASTRRRSKSVPICSRRLATTDLSEAWASQAFRR